MILNKSTQAIIRILLNERDKPITLRILAEKAKISLGMTAKIIDALEVTGFVQKHRGVTVVQWEKLLKGWAYLSSLKEYKRREFLAAERPAYLTQKISQLLKKEMYAFTLFSATDIIAPYVAPNAVHLYILDKDEEKIAIIFKKNGIMEAEKGNIICYIVGAQHLHSIERYRGINIISLPQLYADLISYGGRAEEAAEHILKLMRQKYVRPY